MTTKATVLHGVAEDRSLYIRPESDSTEIEYKPGDIIQCDIKVISGEHRQRSALMNRCLHKYCANLASTLNAHGLDAGIRVTMGDGIASLPAPWTMEAVKELIFKPMLLAVAEVDSTAKATNEQLCETDERIAAFFAGINIEIVWPSSVPPIWR